MTNTGPRFLGNGWATPVPPYITYPVQNVGWGKGSEKPPFAPAKLVPRGQKMLAPPAPSRTAPAPTPASVASQMQPLPGLPPEGPIPVQDFFRMLRG